MQLSKGVEWAAHAASLMVALPDGKALKADALANYHGVPRAYMAKQLQALSKAGIVTSSRGARGGYRLARPASEISLWDIVAAVEGTASAFRCTEIRRNGPCGVAAKDCRTPCSIAAAFAKAEKAYRDALKAVSLADIATGIAATWQPAQLGSVGAWIDREAVSLGA